MLKPKGGVGRGFASIRGASEVLSTSPSEFRI
jgi:hypothetical protein